MSRGLLFTCREIQLGVAMDISTTHTRIMEILLKQRQLLTFNYLRVYFTLFLLNVLHEF